MEEKGHMDETEAADCNRNSSFLLKDEGELFTVLNLMLTDHFNSQNQLQNEA